NTRQLQDRGASVQHGPGRLQALSELSAKARLSTAIPGLPAAGAGIGRRPGMMKPFGRTLVAIILAAAAVTAATAQTPQPPPAGYIIGPDDVLSIVFWRDKD